MRPPLFTCSMFRPFSEEMFRRFPDQRRKLSTWGLIRIHPLARIQNDRGPLPGRALYCNYMVNRPQDPVND